MHIFDRKDCRFEGIFLHCSEGRGAFKGVHPIALPRIAVNRKSANRPQCNELGCEDSKVLQVTSFHAKALSLQPNSFQQT
jgi:hypothetical protein